MDITFYNTNSPPNKLNKTLTEVAKATVSLKDDTNMVSPTIRLSADYVDRGINYCFIPAFERYYFLTDRAVLIGKLAEYSLTVDPLMTWRDSINATKVIAIRSSNKANKLLPDTIPVQANRNVLYRQFKNGAIGFGSDKVSASSKCYCLTVLNGGLDLNPPSGLKLAASGRVIAAQWDAVTGAADYDVVYRLAGQEEYTHYTGTGTLLRSALITVDADGTYEVGIAAKDLLGGIIGQYVYGFVNVGG